MRAQMCVQPVTQSVRCKMLFDIAMRDLGERMDAGIGPPGAVDTNRNPADRLDGGFQRALHRGAVFLILPAAKRPAVIFNGELVTRHQFSRAGGFSGVPRRKSTVFIGCLPARCNSRIRIAPSLHATVRDSSMTSPGSPRPFAGS